MLKFGVMTTMIRIQNKTIIGDDKDFPIEEWTDIIDEDIPCEWQNKFGGEVYKQDGTKARDPAKVRLWYISNVSSASRVVRVADDAVFAITNPDNIMNRGQQLELEIERWVEG